MSRRVSCLVALYAVMSAGVTVRAHHSIAGAYDAKRPLTISGTVRQFHFVNPHPWVELEAPDRGGQIRTWHMEMDNRSELSAIGMDADTLKPGDHIVVFGIAAVAGQYRLYVRRLERPDGLRYEQRGMVPVFTPPPR
jgi:hypothetical protein